LSVVVLNVANVISPEVVVKSITVGNVFNVNCSAFFKYKNASVNLASDKKLPLKVTPE